jgi:KUP system potassium uptake protein
MLSRLTRRSENHSNSIQKLEPNHRRLSNKTMLLAFGALGVVYGDIGTSPLYTIRECFHGIHAVVLTEGNVLGVLSLAFWSITSIVSVKYVVFILRADNRGEGGIFALLGLITASGERVSKRGRSAVMVAGIIGAGLLYGDGVITPSISVLSAIEGLEVATKAATPLILPLTIVVLFSLFLLQRRGTGDIGKLFGPIMVLWFASIAALGLGQIVNAPHVLLSINPLYAYEFFSRNGLRGMLVLGSVVLCVTGAEALYADLGHFGAKAIRISWFSLTCPALLLSYLGQGALLLSHPELNFNPFYGLVPRVLLYPMVALSTIATVIASQALISGVFSLTQQAVELGFLPRAHVVHTSPEVQGQIYIPSVNYLLMMACIAVVVGFRGSSALAGAYGIAVTGTMTITSILYFLVLTETWGWSLWKAIPLVAIFLFFDVSYFFGNLMKVFDGGWFTLFVAALLTIAMTTWRRGREELRRRIVGSRLPLESLLADMARHKIQRVPGVAVFMTVSPVGTPSTLLHHLKHNHMLHEKVIILSISSSDAPVVKRDQRIKIEDLGQGFYRLIALNGFMQSPNVPGMMKIASDLGLATDPSTTTYYLGRETLLTSGKSKMMRWRKALFAFMSRNAGTPAAYFQLPANRVVELGTQIEL